MILDKMVPNVALVFTTLAILNFTGSISCQAELDHGLATNCWYKSMKTQSLFQKSSKFIDKVCCYLDNICGDECSPGTCECGDTTFGFSDNLYCCIPMKETCKIKGM